MIIGTISGPLKIGEIKQNIYVRNYGEEYLIRFCVIREATCEEWLKYRQENNLDIISTYTNPNVKFYKVSTD